MTSKSRLARDYSATSMGVLASKVTEIFEEKLPGAQVWVPDTYQWPTAKSHEVLDVVFFGDFFRKFLETGNWTGEKYRFWGLGSPTKNFFVNLVGLRENQIALLPRELLSRNAASFVKPDRLDQLTFVYAGRLTPSKRILTLLWTVYHLQKEGRDIGLELYGEFFQEEKYCDCPSVNPYADLVRDLIENLDWNKKPILHGKVAASSWVTPRPKPPVYVSLSVLPFEDFALSVAEAQAQGWPAILTNWGVHREVAGSVIKIPLQVFENLRETAGAAEREGKLLADYLLKKSFAEMPSKSETFSVPEIVTLSELDVFRRAFLGRWGMKLQDVIRHRTDDLRGSPEWEGFLKEYVKCFT